MTFPRVQFPYLRCVTASIISLALVSCQGSKKDDKFNNTSPQVESRDKVTVPPSFTGAKVRKMGMQLDSMLTRLHKHRGFNGAVLVTKYDQVIYEGAFGYADFYHKDSLNTQTAFQLGSVSKQFTAMAVMMLKEEGKLSYEDSVQQYFPAFPYHGITIRQLLTHRAGLSNYTYFSDELWHDRRKPMTNLDMVNLMISYQPNVYYKPNTHFDYSNTGYALLAAIVGKASGVPFATFMRERIFRPLKMTHTFLYTNDKATFRGNVAIGHTGGRQKRTTDYLDSVLGDKGVFSTLEDLYKWDQALYTQQLVKHETLAEAFTGSRLKKRNDEDYGFGWRKKPM
jgi:CubicO group peptidase (beta-lactamase class C family)